MKQFAKTGDFCPNEACPDYGKLQDGQQRSIIMFGKTEKGVQRYRCKTCGKTFTETTGTLFFRKRTPEQEILETLALLAEGNRISSLSRNQGFKEETILAWLPEAALHAAAVEKVVLAENLVHPIDMLFGVANRAGILVLAENSIRWLGAQSESANRSRSTSTTG